MNQRPNPASPAANPPESLSIPSALLVPINDSAKLRDLVGYPESEHAWRWLFRCRKERGLEQAFIRVGRRILVDVPAYVAALRKQAGRQ
jgi:hypothetical protein